MVQGDVQQIEHDAFRGVFEDSHPSELHVDVQTRLQLVQHCHGIAHVLGGRDKEKKDSGGSTAWLLYAVWDPVRELYLASGE